MLVRMPLVDNLQMQIEERHKWCDPFDRLQNYCASKVAIKITDKPVQVGRQHR